MYRYKFKKGFSIIEVLITLLVLSLILVLLAPVITRKFAKTDTDGIVYTYVNSGSSTNNNTNQDANKCFITAITGNNGEVEYRPSQNCSSYEFVVPKGVTSVDLTLVAGGGGGGGASGAVYYDTYTLNGGENGNISFKYGYDHLDTEASTVVTTASVKKRLNGNIGVLNINDIKNVMIKYFMAAGQPSKLGGCEYQTCYKIGSMNPNCARCTTSGTETWKDFMGRSKSGEQYYTGTGGNSSIAIVDYEIPLEDYQERLSLNNIKPGGGKNLLIDLIHEYNSREQTLKEFSKLTMGLSLENDSYNHLYSLHRTAGDTKDSGFGDYKDYVKIPKQVGSKGEVAPLFYNEKTKTYSFNGASSLNAVLGGKGGIVAGGKFGSCGSGAQGYSFVQKNGSKDVEYAPSLYPGPACAGISVVYLRENAARTNGFVSPSGGGGAGGNAVKINGFEVSPNEKYIIRVGRGGRGGLGGSDVISDKTIAGVPSPAMQNKLRGEDGESGASTSIWKVNGDNETLVYLVTGGVGGFGSSGYTQTGPIYKISETTGGGASGRHPAMLFSGIESEKLPAEIRKLDNKVAVGRIANNNFRLGTGTTDRITVSGIKLEYPYLRQVNTISPFWYLNAYSTGQACRDNSGDICLGAFDRFNTNNLVTVSNPVVDGQISSDTNVYNGFYYRTLLENNRAGYTGGLGGFSGLGTKAGCGGLFMGNSRGITVNGDNVNGATNTLYKNRFIMPSSADSGTNTDRNAYRVFDYYDNCTLNSNDGQSAEFILPNIRSKTLGQAGSGGGGGGYTVSDGAGKGGRGQNGYVMINWRK